MNHKLLAVIAAAALAGCAHQSPPQYLLDSNGNAASVLLPDGHSIESYIIGGACADPNCVSQQTMVEGVFTTYDVNGRLRSTPHDLRTDVAPSLGMAAASITVPAIIGSAGAIGAGIELGNHIRPNVLTLTNAGSTASAVATGGASSSVSSAMGGAGGAGGNATASAMQTQHQHIEIEAITPGTLIR